MAHFACICLPYHGHLNPMAALARELGRRGHTTTFFHIPDVAPLVARHGLNFVPVGGATHPPGWLPRATNNLGRVTGLFGLKPMFHDFASLTAMLCRNLPDTLRGRSIDMIIADQFEAAGGMVAYHMGLPFVSLAAALPLNWEESIPSPFVGWPYGESRWHRYRNIASAFGAKAARKPISDVIEAYSTQWRLGRGRQIEEYMSGFAQLSQLTPSLDFPRRAVIGCFHYCGPLREPAPATPAVSRQRKSGRAFASLGTLQGHRADIFERIVAATRACGLDLTIAHGGRLSGAAAARLARHAEVHAFVAHDDVFPQMDVAILHGGLNTVLDALAAGLPIVVLPLAFEQGAIASRIERSGTGRVVAPRVFRRRRLEDAIRDVTATGSYAEAVANVRRELAASGGVVRAADIVDHVARTGHPCLNA